jgi:hypothetical protein
MHIRAILAAGALASALTLAAALPATAHEGDQIGDLSVEVGFAIEPVFTGQANAALIQLAHDGDPVMDLREMTVVVSTGDQESEPMNLEPAFFIEDGQVESGTPGEYRASFVPTQPGTYSFHFVGSVDGEKFDEEYTSGPKTFDDVQDVAAASFPQVTAPSSEDLATRITQESERTAASVQAAESAAVSAADDASGARTLGLIGIVVGALGVIVGVAGFATARRSG